VAIKRAIANIINKKSKLVFDYVSYWENRYRDGGTSGSGSYGETAIYKSGIVNKIVENNNILSVIDFGCGDGNQLTYCHYKKYLGLDVSQTAIEICCKKFSNDFSKSFMVYNPRCFKNNGYLSADLVICMDVLYHITDENDYNKTIDDIFSCCPKIVILFTALYDFSSQKHIITRDIFSAILRYPQYEVADIIKQEHTPESVADFLILKKKI
jgi:2-polyprenyl-3-methyl-5-hydroxy-6-metoxy-1,4-benzoquinol methylase